MAQTLPAAFKAQLASSAMLFPSRKFQLCANAVAPGKLQVGLKISDQLRAGSHFKLAK